MIVMVDVVGENIHYLETNVYKALIAPYGLVICYYLVLPVEFSCVGV